MASPGACSTDATQRGLQLDGASDADVDAAAEADVLGGVRVADVERPGSSCGDRPFFGTRARLVGTRPPLLFLTVRFG